MKIDAYILYKYIFPNKAKLLYDSLHTDNTLADWTPDSKLHCILLYHCADHGCMTKDT